MDRVDWKKKLAAAGVTLSLVWITWVSASIPSIREAQAAATVEHTLNAVARSQVIVLHTELAVMDTKLNLLLLSKGIPIPETPAEGSSSDD